MAETKKTVSAVPSTRTHFVVDLPINRNCPPVRVRVKRTGQVTNWSTIFSKRLSSIEPYFRDEQEFREWRLRVRRWEAATALQGGDPYAGMDKRGSTMVFDDEADAELAALTNYADPA